MSEKHRSQRQVGSSSRDGGLHVDSQHAKKKKKDKQQRDHLAHGTIDGSATGTSPVRSPRKKGVVASEEGGIKQQQQQKQTALLLSTPSVAVPSASPVTHAQSSSSPAAATTTRRSSSDAFDIYINGSLCRLSTPHHASLSVLQDDNDADADGAAAVVQSVMLRPSLFLGLPSGEGTGEVLLRDVTGLVDAAYAATLAAGRQPGQKSTLRSDAAPKRNKRRRGDDKREHGEEDEEKDREESEDSEKESAESDSASDESKDANARSTGTRLVSTPLAGQLPLPLRLPPLVLSAAAGNGDRDEDGLILASIGADDPLSDAACRGLPSSSSLSSSGGSRPMPTPAFVLLPDPVTGCVRVERGHCYETVRFVGEHLLATGSLQRTPEAVTSWSSAAASRAAAAAAAIGARKESDFRRGDESGPNTSERRLTSASTSEPLLPRPVPHKVSEEFAALSRFLAERIGGIQPVEALLAAWRGMGEAERNAYEQ